MKAMLILFVVITTIYGFKIDKKKTLFPLNLEKNKALIVIVRQSKLGANNEDVLIYCDRHLVIANQYNTINSFYVLPGEHFIMGVTDDQKEGFKINAIAGNTYYYEHIVDDKGLVIYETVFNWFKPISYSDSKRIFESGVLSCTLYSRMDEDELYFEDEEEWYSEISDFELMKSRKPETYKLLTEYTGYNNKCKNPD